MGAMYVPAVGRLIEPGENALRDAIHLAVAPVEAGEELEPGQRVVLAGGKAYVAAGVKTLSVGVVDPFLTSPVKKGDRFWLFVYPNTVMSLRHVWTHPAFAAVVPAFVEKEDA